MGKWKSKWKIGGRCGRVILEQTSEIYCEFVKCKGQHRAKWWRSLVLDVVNRVTFCCKKNCQSPFFAQSIASLIQKWNAGCPNSVTQISYFSLEDVVKSHWYIGSFMIHPWILASIFKYAYICYSPEITFYNFDASVSADAICYKFIKWKPQNPAGKVHY